MKKIISLLLVLALCAGLSVAAFAEAEKEEPAPEIDWPAVWESLDLELPPDVEFDYGTSELYTPEDLVSALALILDEFATWEGTEMHKLAYMGDECNTDENVKWMNDLKNAKAEKETDDSDPDFTQCICFESSFHSPKEASGAWEADHEYTGWQWWLARADEGPWQLLTWGY